METDSFIEDPLKWLNKNKTNLFKLKTFSVLLISLVSILIVSMTMFHSIKLSYVEMNLKEKIRLLDIKRENHSVEIGVLSYQIVKLQSVLDELTDKNLFDFDRWKWRALSESGKRKFFYSDNDPMKSETEPGKMEIQLESTREFFKTFKDFDFSKNITNDEKPLNQIREIKRSIENIIYRADDLLVEKFSDYCY